MKKLITMVFALTLLLNLDAFAAGTGKVIAFKGKAYLLQYQRGYKKVPIKRNMLVHSKDIVLTKASAVVKIRLADGSSVTIRPNSRIQFAFVSNKSQRINVGNGGMLSKVNKLRGKKGYHVDTPTTVAGVRGTKFIVEYNEADKSNRIDVYDGKVSYSRETVRIKNKMVPHNGGFKMQKMRDIHRSRKRVGKGGRLEFKDKSRMSKQSADPKLLKEYESLMDGSDNIEVSGWEYN